MGAIGRQRRGTPRVLLALLAVAVATMPTVATRANDTSETGNVAPGPDLTLVRAQIKAKNWAGAQAGLSVIAARVEHADVYNLLGFVHRNQGAHQTALL